MDSCCPCYHQAHHRLLNKDNFILDFISRFFTCGDNIKASLCIISRKWLDQTKRTHKSKDFTIHLPSIFKYVPLKSSFPSLTIPQTYNPESDKSSDLIVRKTVKLLEPVSYFPFGNWSFLWKLCPMGPQYRYNWLKWNVYNLLQKWNL